MKRAMLALVTGLVVGSMASAHFIWIVPNPKQIGAAMVVFSDSLGPDETGDLLDKIAQTKLWLRGRDGKDLAITWKKEDKYYALNLPGATGTIGGICDYGVVARGNTKPYLLKYYPKLVFGRAEDKPWERLPFEAIPVPSEKGVRVRVLYQGKPAPEGVEVVLHNTKGDKFPHLKTDAKGEVVFEGLEPGVYGIRALFIENKAGEKDGKKYEEIRHRATVVILVV